MQFRHLGSSGLKISVIGLGTWAIGGGDWKFGWGDQDESEAIGELFVPSSWELTGSKRPPFMAKAAVRCWSRKLWRPSPKPTVRSSRPSVGEWPWEREIGKCLTRSSVIAECEASLRRLNTDCIDW